VAGHAALVGLGRALGDRDHVGDAVLALAGLAARLAQRPAGAQVARQLTLERAPRLDVERLVDRLRGHPHLRVVGEAAAQPPGDLLGRVATNQIVLHDPAQREVGRELGRLGAARAVVGQRVRHRRAVTTVAVGVATQLARDRRRRPSQAPGDRSDRLARARASAISSRSANDRQRPLRLRPRRGRRPPQAATQRVPCLRYVPTATAASAMNSPRCSVAQNGCTTSGTWALTNRAIGSS